jgi:hypothetical protein
VPPAQQPLAQVVASHAHVPLVVSQLPCAHIAQAAPPVPHWVVDSEAYGTHVPVGVQQPLAQDVALQPHWPDTHC